MLNPFRCLMGAVLLMVLDTALGGGALPPERSNGEVMYVTGSTLMTAYTTAVMEHIGKNAGLPNPMISSGGSGRGIALFCSGVGLNTPDIVAVSRNIRSTEIDDCQNHGVTEIIEIQIGYDAAGIVSRHDDQDYPLTVGSMYRAIAAELPTAQGDFAPNHYRHWHDVDPSLPDTEIRFIVPAPSLGGRTFLEDRMLQSACRSIPEVAAIFDAEERVKQCVSLRKDGRILEVDAPYAENVVKALASSPAGTLANIPLRFVVEHQEFMKVQPFDGVIPEYETVSNRQYGFIRPLYFLIKKAHVKNYAGKGLVDGLREFITEATRESTIGPSGYLTKLGLFPMDEKNRTEIRNSSLRLRVLN